MTSFTVMRSSTSTNSDLPYNIRPQQQQFQQDLNNNNNSYNSTPMTVEGILHETFTSDPPVTESTLLDSNNNQTPMDITTTETTTRGSNKSVDEVWRDIVSGKGMKEEEETQEEIMTLEDFLAKAAVEDNDIDVKIPMNYGFDEHNNPFQMIDKVEGSIVAFGDVYGEGEKKRRGKRGRVMVEPLDKAAAQRQRRMIKNRESAARSRERKQAYQVELESMAARLEEENEMLSREVDEKRKERYKRLMEFVIPVVEKPQEPRFLRRIRSLEW